MAAIAGLPNLPVQSAPISVCPHCGKKIEIDKNWFKFLEQLMKALGAVT